MDSYNGLSKHPENSFFFIRSLTFIGGFLNAYSYYTRGNAFVTFHTGNLVRTGLAIIERNPIVFWNSITPIIAGFIGAVLAALIKNKTSSEGEFHKKVIYAEIVLFAIVGLTWSDSINNIVNFLLSMVAMYQLSSFRKIKTVVHNSTIMTGNLRTLAQFFAEMITCRNKQSLYAFITYFVTFLSFVLGVIVGGFLSMIIGHYAIWTCSVILIFLVPLLNRSSVQYSLDTKNV